MRGKGTLDRVDRAMQFTHIDIRARLRVPPRTNGDQARRALDKAEHNCLISNSLKATTQLETEVDVARERPDTFAGEYAETG